MVLLEHGIVFTSNLLDGNVMALVECRDLDSLKRYLLAVKWFSCDVFLMTACYVVGAMVMIFDAP